jgi:Bacterial regulatory proteins, luxR family
MRGRYRRGNRAPIGLHAGEIGPGEMAAARPVVLAGRLASLAREEPALASSVVRELVAGDPGLSQHLDARYALRVTERNPARTGYLLKDRVTDSRVLTNALERIAGGGCVIDPAVAEGLVSRASALARIEELTEREVLALVAEGLTNRAIAERLVVTQKTVERPT